jgi:hypothetical protein
MRTMIVLSLMAAAVSFGCEKTEPAKPKPPEYKIKPFDENTDAHMVLWERGALTGRVVIEFKNMPDYIKITISAKHEKEGNKLVFPGKILGETTCSDAREIIVYEDRRKIRIVEPRLIWVHKEKE